MAAVKFMNGNGEVMFQPELENGERLYNFEEVSVWEKPLCQLPKKWSRALFASESEARGRASLEDFKRRENDWQEVEG